MRNSDSNKILTPCKKERRRKKIWIMKRKRKEKKITYKIRRMIEKEGGKKKIKPC